MRSLTAVAFALYAYANAQGGPGGGQAPGGQMTSTGDMISDSYTATSTSQIPQETAGPFTDVAHLEGTWSSKSQMVMTGPDFYDPIDELLIEPALPGIAYSFTSDGFWEEAIYQVTSNPVDPTCPSAALTFQHGTYNISNGQLLLTPFQVDGRQLVSTPCNATYSTYTRYNQTEKFSKFDVSLDMYYGRYKLNLYQWDGTPMAPLYLVYRPPMMLPTVTLNPTGSGSSNSSSTGSKTARSIRERIKRSLVNRARSTNAELIKDPLYDKLWWIGVSLIGAGTMGWIWLS